MRIMAEPDALAQHFANGKMMGVCFGKDLGCPFHTEDKQASVKWLTWIWDYADGQLKLASLPWAVARELVAFQEADEYAFTDWPMPFDITVEAKNAGKMDVEYSVIAARSNTDIPAEALKEFAEKDEIPVVIAAMKEKSMKALQPEEEEKPKAKRPEYPKMDETNDASGI